VGAAVTLVALPVAAAVIWALLRSPTMGARLVAVPSGERWHARPTPTFGGVGIVAGLLAGVALALLVGAVAGSWELAGIVAGCVLLFAAGLLDDVRHLSPLAKLAAQFAAAGLAIAAGLRVELIENDPLGIVVALVWLVGITNAFNLLDNMDGLSAGVAFTASLVLLLNAWLLGEFFISLVLVALMGSLLGFLVYNWHPPRRTSSPSSCRCWCSPSPSSTPPP
jgi:UDP-GlcNAc:undecaprenyl-phosphate GlcNAc-1-phosphate transferase